MHKEVSVLKFLAFMEFALKANMCFIVYNTSDWALIESSEQNNFILINLEGSHIEAWNWQLQVKQSPTVLTLA